MKALMTVVFTGLIFAFCGFKAYAQEAFEKHGYIDAVDPVVRTIKVYGITYRIDEDIHVNLDGKRVPAMIAVQPGIWVSFSGLKLATEELLIQSLAVNPTVPSRPVDGLQLPQEQ